MSDFLKQEPERTRQVYQACLDLVPHKKVSNTFLLVVHNISTSVCVDVEEEPYFFLLLQFTFAKMWLLFAQFEIRQKNLQAARKIMVRLLTLTLISWTSEWRK